MAKKAIAAKGKVKAKVSKKPVKAGSSKPKNVGGIVNVKVVATAKKVKNG
jgi:hypothetical protein